MESGKNGLRAGRNKAMSVQKQLEDYKRIIGELTIANDALKNVGGRQRLMARRQIRNRLSLRKALLYTDVSR